MRPKRVFSKLTVLLVVMAMLLQMMPMGVAYAVTDGAYIVGGGSGGGGGGSQGSSGAGGAGGNGGSNDQSINGTAGDDVIFGDGSGGGAGCRSISYAVINTRGGFGGSGVDTITGGAGDDVIFGDGFHGENSTGWGGGKGGLGGGGGGATGGHFGTAPNAGPGGVGGGGGGGGKNSDNATYGLGGSTIVSGVGSSGANDGGNGGNSATTVGAVTGSGGAAGTYSGGGGGFGGAAGGAGGEPGAAGANGDTSEHRYSDTGHAVRDYFSESALRSVLTNYPNFGAGNDIIDGEGGSNELFGLGGNNTFIVDSDDSATGNRIWDFKAGDKLLLQTTGVTVATLDIDTVLTGAVVGDYDGDTDSDDTRITFSSIPIDLINVDYSLNNVSGEIVSPNASPTVALNNSSLGYLVSASAVQIDSTGTVSDSDGDNNWNNGGLAIQITGNANAGDAISISDTDGSAPLIAVVASTTILRADGVNVGVLSHSNGTATGGTALTITFESNATNAIVQEVLQSLRFSTNALGSGNRTVTIAATDFAAALGQDTRTIAVAAAPTFVSAETNVAGTQVTATFDKNMMADPSGKQGQFDIEVDGDADAATAIANAGSNDTLELTLTTAVANGQTVTIAYTAGDVTAADESALATFGAQLVTNNVPAPDETSPTVGGGGTITPSNATQNTIDLNWTAATDDVSAQADLQYKVVRSTSNNINNVADAETNGTVVQDWIANITSKQATGLSESTTYYFNVIVKDEAGNKTAYTLAQQATGSGFTGGSSLPVNTGVDILVNGKTENAGTASNTSRDGQNVITITVDPDRLEQKLAAESDNAIVTIPVNTDSDIVIGELNGQMVKNMEDRQAVVEVKTAAATYTLPAQEINIDAISKQIGVSVRLSDIKVRIEIAKTGKNTVKIVEDSVSKGGLTLVAEPLDFNITCTLNDKTVEVSRFNAFVERTVAIPVGIDPNKITTGIIVEADGTMRHVPTRITFIGGRYYAKINSLTNSTYSVVWSPLEFKDAASHWAQETVNDMGSRMVVKGTGNGNFEPDEDITRGEFAAVMVRALGLKPGTGSNRFGDVENSEWYSSYVGTATEYGIISGYANGEFGPMDKITREQVMSMVVRAMKITGLEANLSAADTDRLLTGYEDGSEASVYARDGIAACIKTGIVSGRSSKTVAPTDYITRAEAAAVVRRLLQKSNLI